MNYNPVKLYHSKSAKLLFQTLTECRRLFQNHPRGNMNRILHKLTQPVYSQLEKLTRAGFELASSGYRTAALPVELSS